MKILLKPVFIIALVAIAMIGVMVPSVFAENDKIPDWVRNIFLWYGQEQISETELLNAITYLIDDEIIDVPKIKSLEGENNFLKQKIRELESSLVSNEEYQTKLQDALIEEKQQSVSISENSSKSQIEILARTNPYLNGIITGTINIHVQPVPSYADPRVSEDVDSILKSIDGTVFGSYITLRVVSNANDADIKINWVKDFGSEKLGHAVFKSFVEVGLGEDNCQGDWQAFDTLTVTKIFWHELGHSIGYNHSTKSDNIMYPTIPTQFVTDVDTTFVLDEGYYKTITFCKSGSMNYNLSSDNQNNGFYAYVLPSTTDPTQFLNNVGEYYPSCSTEDPMVSFGSTCNVVIGDKLMVYNKDDYLQTSAIQINLKVIDMNTMSDVDYNWDFDAFQYDLEWVAQIYDLFH